MYLPPRIDSIAFSGFGGQIEVSNTFGSNNNGYGEVENVQDTFAKSPTTDFSNYGLSSKTTDDASGVQTTLGSYDSSTHTSNGPIGSSLDQSNGYKTVSPGGNNFGQLLNKNNDHISGGNLPGTNNYYGSSLDTALIPTNNDFVAQAGTEDGYGQNDLLNTAQNQSLTKYNGATATSQFGQHPTSEGYQYSQQGTIGNMAGDYGNVDLITSKPSLQDNNRIGGQNPYGQGGNGNVGPNGGLQFSIDNSEYGNTEPNLYSQKYTSRDQIYSQIGNGNRHNTQLNVEKSIDISNNPSSIGSAGFPSSVPNFYSKDNPITKSTSQSNNNIINGNYGQNEFSNNRGFQAEGYSKEVSSSGYGPYPRESNQGVSATTQSYGQNDFEKPKTDSYSLNFKDLPHSGESFSQSLPINNGFEQSPTNAYNQKVTGINKDQIGGTSIIGSQSLDSVGTSNGVQSSGEKYQNSYSQSSSGVQSFNQEQGSSNYDNGFDLSPQSQLQSSNNFGQSGSHSIGNEGNYGQISPAYNRFNQDQQNYQMSNSYGPTTGPSQLFINGRNPVQSQPNGPANDGYNEGRPSNGPNGFDESRPSTPQVSNNYTRSEYQPSSLSDHGYGQSGPVPSSSGEYYQGSSSNELNDFGQNRPSTPQGGRPNNNGPAGSQSLSTTRNSFNQNSNTNGAYPQEAPQDSKSYGENSVKHNSLNRDNIATAQLGYSQNGLATQSSGQENSSSLPGYGQRIGPCTSKNGGDVGQGKTSTVSPSDPSYEIRNQKKHSTLVPKGQFQNSNLPNSGKGVQISSNANNNGNNYGEPGHNSFSNFSPGNQPNQPINPGTNNCDTSKRGDATNGAAFSPLNTGY
ncbi:GATA zinc finger domain-containing protein 14-like isoform X2 [Acyrthosiphon pisum]|nr:GATA zinc finger domain-containing protein 14-like isoform X2 [Acyrthosiphon pisum]